MSSFAKMVPAENTMDSLTLEAIKPYLRTNWVASSYAYHPCLDSTNDEAIRLAEQGAPRGTIVVADQQTAGRGRAGRKWHSPAKANIYFSLILRFPDKEPAALLPLTLAAAVGVARAVGAITGKNPTVKWPNDLLYGGRKLCGILSEMKTRERTVHYVILGIGINVNLQEMPSEFISRSTSLYLEFHRSFSRAQLLAAVFDELEYWLNKFEIEGPSPIIQSWLSLADWLKKQITVQRPQGPISGIAVGLDERGALPLRSEDGRLITIHTGELDLEHPIC
jgi:BirA family biotin operon repressor/biotin-[acetyl-CoA-carboxylase] ligase